VEERKVEEVDPWMRSFTVFEMESFPGPGRCLDELTPRQWQAMESLLWAQTS